MSDFPTYPKSLHMGEFWEVFMRRELLTELLSSTMSRSSSDHTHQAKSQVPMLAIDLESATQPVSVSCLLWPHSFLTLIEWPLQGVP